MREGPAPSDQPPHRSDPVVSTLLTECPELAEVVEEFVRGLPDRMRSMEEALRAHSLEQLASVAHQLKGAGGSHGYAAITAKAGMIEHAARVGAIDELDATLAELASLIDRVRAGIRRK